jgi:hypothetical protein
VVLIDWFSSTGAAAAGSVAPWRVNFAAERSVGSAELVHAFPEQMPTGVTVADDGRTFICYPRWGDPVEFTVAELRDGEEVPYQPEFNIFDPQRPGECLVSVQSVVVDPGGRLWLLDTGSTEFAPPIAHGPKLVCVDLGSNEVVQTIPVPPDVALETTYLNDIRFDLRRGEDVVLERVVVDAHDPEPHRRWWSRARSAGRSEPAAACSRSAKPCCRRRHRSRPPRSTAWIWVSSRCVIPKSLVMKGVERT